MRPKNYLKSKILILPPEKLALLKIMLFKDTQIKEDDPKKWEKMELMNEVLGHQDRTAELHSNHNLSENLVKENGKYKTALRYALDSKRVPEGIKDQIRLIVR